MSATIVRQAARPNLRLVADHGRIITDPRGPVRIVAPRAAPEAAFRPPARELPARKLRNEIPPRRVAGASLRLTRRGRLVVTVGVILLVAAVSMMFAVRGYAA